jgi:hypothetical protein
MNSMLTPLSIAIVCVEGGGGHMATPNNLVRSQSFSIINISNKSKITSSIS